ncbi:hypothetical protein [Flavivirga aquatica]|uniref:hypothetical protein n=1 Tax=Flavivirga aquatica TaxID=1849968 RepID=UPI0013F4F184|nr:hypothetical protein [Flavivirga aquatica]
MGKDTKELSSHSSEEILEKHYIDKTIVHAAVKKVKKQSKSVLQLKMSKKG